MRLKKLYKKTFEQGNTCVCGLRGTGKDMLMSNVIARRKQVYISNVDYKAKKSVHIPLDIRLIDVKNNYENLLNKDVVPYDYPYPEKADIYISDAGVYFPAQYNEQLNKKYSTLPVFSALSRQIAQCNVHYNVQSLNRVWDKFREQADIYISCRWCKVLPFKIVVQKIYLYDRFESAVNSVKPFKPLRAPLLSGDKNSRALIRAKNDELKRAFDEKNGSVKSRILIYRNKSQYDTRLFKSILGGKNNV